MSGLVISGLKVSRGGKPVLGGGAAAVPSPGVALCTGPNGSGKTTLLEAIAGILPSSDGSVSLGGRVADLKVESWRNTVGYLASDGGTVPLLTAAEQLRLVMEISGVGRGEAEVRIEQLADIYTLGESLHTRADALSTGTRKRLGIAITVATRADVYLLDEPSAGLDFDGVRLLVDTLSFLRDCGATLVVTSHTWETFADVSDRWWRIVPDENGALLMDGGEPGSRTGDESRAESFDTHGGSLPKVPEVELPWLRRQ